MFVCPVIRIEKEIKMNAASRVLSAVFVIFAYFYLFSYKYEKESSLQKFNQELLDLKLYPSFLEMAFVAASSGMNFFPMPNSPSENCIRTATVFMQLFAKPSTSKKISSILSSTFSKAAEDVNLDKTIQDSVELVCGILNNAIKQNQFDFANFEQLKKTAILPKGARNSLLEIPGEQITYDLVKSLIGRTDNPEFLRYLVVSCFKMSVVGGSDKNNLEEYASVTAAIYQLAEQNAFKSTVDSEFSQVLEDYIVNDIINHTYIHKAQLAAISNPVFAKKVDQYFLKNSVLAEEYTKIKKRAIDKYKSDKKFEEYKF